MFTDIPRPHVDLDEARRFHEKALQAAEKGKNPVLAEMAKEVRSGRMTLREAAASPAYRETFNEAAGKFIQAVRKLSVEEIRQAAESGSLGRIMAAQVAADEQRQSERDETETPAKADAEADDVYFGGSIIEKPGEPTRPEHGVPQRARWVRRWSH